MTEFLIEPNIREIYRSEDVLHDNLYKPVTVVEDDPDDRVHVQWDDAKNTLTIQHHWPTSSEPLEFDYLVTSAEDAKTALAAEWHNIRVTLAIIEGLEGYLATNQEAIKNHEALTGYVADLPYDLGRLAQDLADNGLRIVPIEEVPSGVSK